MDVSFPSLLKTANLTNNFLTSLEGRKLKDWALVFEHVTVKNSTF